MAMRTYILVLLFNTVTSVYGGGFYHYVDTSIALRCTHSYPQNLTWIRNDSRPLNHSTVTTTQNTSYLIIANADPSDAGLYLCVYNETTPVDSYWVIVGE